MFWKLKKSWATRRNIWKCLTMLITHRGRFATDSPFPAVALLSSHGGCSTSSLLRSAQRALCLMSTLLNGSLLSELSAQQTLCSDLLNELSAQQTLCCAQQALWPLALNQLHSSSLLYLRCCWSVMVDFVQAIVSPCHIVILACCQLGTL